MRQMQGTQYSFLGDPKKAMETFLLRAREATQTGSNGPLFNTYRSIGSILIHTGDLGQAETYLRKSQALLAQVRTSNVFPLYGSNWRAEVDEETGELAEASRHNVFIEKGGVLLTPPVEAGALPGIARRRVLDDPRFKASEATLSMADLCAADRIWLSNAVRGLVEVVLATNAVAVERQTVMAASTCST